jgi:heat shock protein HtpX
MEGVVKRVFLFVLTNLAVMLVAGIAMQLLGVPEMLAARGLETRLTGLLIFSALFGMTGSFISLALSKTIAKRSVGAVVIREPRSQTEQWLLQTVARQAQAAGIGMPEVAIYEDPTPNAFATGARRDAALVAVSTGLLRGMTADEVEGVLAHEISHVANGDMVTLSLIQGVLNTFVIFFSYIVGMIVDSFLRRGEEDRGPGIGAFVARMAAQIVFGVLASLIVMWFSRQREFRADAGGARLASPAKMIGALERLRTRESAPLPESLAAFGISTGKHGARWFATHPSLEERIERLRASAGLSA